MDGWIKMHRKFLKWEWYHNIPCKVLAIHYLLAANFEDKKWEGRIIQRGQLVIGLPSLSSHTGLSVQQIRTANRKLVDCGFCHIQSTNKYSIVTLCNYNSYQQSETANLHTANKQPTFEPHPTNSQATSEPHSINNNIRTKEHENIKTQEHKNEYTTAPTTQNESEQFDGMAFMVYFNNTFKGKLPEIKAMTAARKKAVSARLTEHGRESIHTVFRQVQSSPFLLGQNEKNWRCDFDWIFKPANYVKILEGNYNDSAPHTPQHKHTGGLAEQRKKGVSHTAQLAQAILQSYSSEEHT